MTTAEELKVQFAMKFGQWHYESNAILAKKIINEEFMSELDTLIEAVIAERMPNDEEIQEQALHSFIDASSYNTVKKTVDWFRNKMREA